MVANYETYNEADSITLGGNEQLKAYENHVKQIQHEKGISYQEADRLVQAQLKAKYNLHKDNDMEESQGK